jgi:hypothetical protein
MSGSFDPGEQPGLAPPPRAGDKWQRPFDASNKHDVDLRNRRLNTAQKNRENVIGAILEQREGRELMWWFLEQCHIFTSSYTPGDPHQTTWREGERAVGLKMLSLIMAAAPDSYAIMQREAADNAKQEQTKEKSKAQHDDDDGFSQLD